MHKPSAPVRLVSSHSPVYEQWWWNQMCVPIVPPALPMFATTLPSWLSNGSPSVPLTVCLVERIGP